MKALLVVVALAAPHVADAGGCREVSRVVGYSECRHFGWWSSSTAMSWDAGTSLLRFAASPSGAMPADGTPVTALGLRARAIVSFPHQLYLVAQVDLAEMIASPRLVVDTMMVPSSGSVVQDSVALGWRTPLGPLTVAGELAPSFRLPTWTVHVPQEVQVPGSWTFTLQARAKIDAWLSSSWSVGLAAGSDVLQTGDYSLAVTLGLHAVPFDGLH